MFDGCLIPSRRAASPCDPQAHFRALADFAALNSLHVCGRRLDRSRAHRGASCLVRAHGGLHAPWKCVGDYTVSPFGARGDWPGFRKRRLSPFVERFIQPDALHAVYGVFQPDGAAAATLAVSHWGEIRRAVSSYFGGYGLRPPAQRRQLTSVGVGRRVGVGVGRASASPAQLGPPTSPARSPSICRSALQDAARRSRSAAIARSCRPHPNASAHSVQDAVPARLPTLVLNVVPNDVDVHSISSTVGSECILELVGPPHTLGL